MIRRNCVSGAVSGAPSTVPPSEEVPPSIAAPPPSLVVAPAAPSG
jgi:hypothetical protein